MQGALSVRRAGLEAVSVFILPPSYEILRARLIDRQSESASALALRLKNARAEVGRYKEFDYVILNDDATRAAAQLASIVFAERARRVRQEPLARRVLGTFPQEATA